MDRAPAAPTPLDEELRGLLRTDDGVAAFLQATSMDGIWLWDLERPERLWMSDKFWRHLGYAPESRPSTMAAVREVVHPADAEAGDLALRRHLGDRAHAPIDELVRCRHRDGTWHTIRCRGLAIRMVGGRYTRLLGANVNVTAHVETERLLLETGLAARVGGWSFTVATGEIYYSAALNEIHGLYGPQEWTSERALSYYADGPEKEELTAAFARCVAEGTPYEVDFQIVTEQGERRWVSAFGHAQFGPDGKPSKVYGSFQDIHEKKVNALRLARNEALLRKNFELAPNGMVIADAGGHFKRVSQSFADMLGYSVIELLGKRFADVTYPEDAEEDGLMMGRFAAGEIESHRTQKRYVRKAGDVVWADVSIAVLRDERGDPLNYYVQLVDITEARQAAATQRRILLLEDKAREMEQFAYIASHDLRQPVLTVMGYLEALTEDFGERLADGGMQYVNVMHDAMTRMDAMIHGLLDYSRLSKAKQLQSVDLNVLLGEVTADLHHLIEQTHAALTVEDLPAVEGFPTELRQLFQNLIANALTYTRPGVTPEVVVSCAEVEGGHRFEVADNGAGIAEHNLGRVFKLFQRVAPEARADGSGVGLATCRTIVERHGGNLWVESTLGKGSKFRFTLLRPST